MHVSLSLGIAGHRLGIWFTLLNIKCVVTRIIKCVVNFVKVVCFPLGGSRSPLLCTLVTLGMARLFNFSHSSGCVVVSHELSKN